MKESRTAKLYSTLSKRELASAALFHAADQNTFEIERIVGAVGRANYNCLDKDFMEQHTYLSSVVIFWGSEYWRKLFMHTAALLETYCTDGEQPKKWERIDATAAAVDTWHAVLAAWCDKHGLDLATAYKLAGVDPSPRESKKKDIDHAEVELWLEELASFSPCAL
jgi:hypothetical protein